MQDSGMSGVFAGYSSKKGMVGNYALMEITQDAIGYRNLVKVIILQEFYN